MTYFDDSPIDRITDVPTSLTTTDLRSCQIGGYWAVKSHFTTTSSTPATISIPTGGGKTALMMLLAFGFDAQRVLVISPSQTIRNQTAKKFRNLEGLKKAGVVEGDPPGPNTYEIETQVESREDWHELEEYDVLVACPNTTSPVYDDNIEFPPDGYFDLVFFDEAHHARAPSWQKLVRELDDARRILLTATPFRRDRQTLPGELVYHYPLSQAMDDKIYESVKLRPFKPNKETNRHQELSQRAEEVLDELNATLFDTADISGVKALIRTNEIESAKKIKRKYDNHTDLAVERVDSDRSPDDNREVLEEKLENELDGVITVGKLGEGLDKKQLKLAVLHHPPKSFPFTIQLVGRVTRPVEDRDISATVLADPRQMKEEGVNDKVRELYREDQAWYKLIPGLVREFVDELTSDIELDRLLAGLRRKDITPPLSVTVYRVSPDDYEPSTEPTNLPVEDIFRVDTSEDDYAGWVTENTEKPTWAGQSSLTEITYDLHLYYYDRTMKRLFEHTSSDRIASKIRSEIVNGAASVVRPEELAGLINGTIVDSFLNAGLRSGQGKAAALPSYKMYLGSQVEAAVGYNDWGSFNSGHALARLPKLTNDPDEITTRGVALENGTVWASSRKPLDEFVGWCESIASGLRTAETSRIQLLGLQYPTNIDSFESKPYHVAIDPELYLHELKILDEREDPDSIAYSEYENEKLVYQPKFEIEGWSESTPAHLSIEFYPSPELPSISGTYDVSTDDWRGPLANYTFRLTQQESEIFTGLSGEELLSEYPPDIHLGNGTLVRGGNRYEFRNTPKTVSTDTFIDQEEIDWTNCDRRVEYRNDKIPQNNKQTVHEWTEEYIRRDSPEDQIVFRDHSKGEIADYVVIHPEAQSITFYHCKSGAKNDDNEISIGASVGRVTGALDQVLRSVLWIKNPQLLGRIEGRHDRDIEPDFVCGYEDFKELLEENFQPAEYKYEVISVLPSLDHKAARRNDDVNALLITCIEWLKQVGASFRIIGDDGRLSSKPR